MTDDTHTHTPPTFLERLGRLAGQTTYRIPVEGVGTRFGCVPESHALAAALSYARGRKWQPGPEICYAKATGVEHKRSDVIEWLTGKIHAYVQATGRQNEERVRGIAMIAYCMTVRGNESVAHLSVGAHVMKLANLGASWLEACMEDTLWRAEQQAKSSPKKVAETA